MSKPSARLHADHAPRLTMMQLKAARVLQSDRAMGIELLDSPARAGVRRVGQRLIVMLEDASQDVPLAFVKLKHGLRPFFLCPVSGERCATLYLVEGRLLGPKAAGLAYATQSMTKAERDDQRIALIVAQLDGEDPARGKRRQRLLERLRQEPQELLSIEALAALDREKERRRTNRYRRRRPARWVSPLTTRRALTAGRRGPPSLPSRKVLQYLYDAIALSYPSLAPAGLIPSEAARVSRKTQPQLDIRALKPKRGLARGHAPTWHCPDGSVVRGLAELRSAGDGPEELLIELHHGDVDVRQRLAVVGGKRAGDRFLVCPVSGSRHVKLHFRDGRFASCAAQKLS